MDLWKEKHLKFEEWYYGGCLTSGKKEGTNEWIEDVVINNLHTASSSLRLPNRLDLLWWSVWVYHFWEPESTDESEGFGSWSFFLGFFSCFCLFFLLHFMCSMEILCTKKLKLMRCADDDDDDDDDDMCVLMKLEWICCVWLTFSERVHQDYLNKLNRFVFFIVVIDVSAVYSCWLQSFFWSSLKGYAKIKRNEKKSNRHTNVYTWNRSGGPSNKFAYLGLESKSQDFFEKKQRHIIPVFKHIHHRLKPY